MIERTEAQAPSIEPGLLPAFRMLATLPIVAASLIFLLNVLGLTQRLEAGVTIPAYGRFTGVFITCFVFTLLYLFLPGLPIRLGSLYLPIALFLSSLGPILIFAFALYLGDALDATRLVVARSPASFYLLVPTVLIAWQYKARTVLLYSLSITALKLLIVSGVYLQGLAPPPGVLRFLTEQLVIFLTIGYLASRLIQSQRQQRAALTNANAKLVAYASTLEQLTVSRERNAMARELHDTIAHYFSGLVLQLEGASLLWEAEPQRAKTTLDQAIGTARNGLDETRHALRALRASALDDLGLLAALRHLAVSLAERNGAMLDLQLPSLLPVIPPAIEQTIYRIAQEALTNSERHANAKTFLLLLRQDANHLVLEISDDGAGFDSDEAAASNRLGLKGMNERAESVGGRLNLESKLGGGTQVRFEVRIEQKVLSK